MGALLSLVARKLSLPVLGATDLGVEQTHALHRIFKVLGDAVSSSLVRFLVIYVFPISLINLFSLRPLRVL